jgi:hypothetical protein
MHRPVVYSHGFLTELPIGLQIGGAGFPQINGVMLNDLEEGEAAVDTSTNELVVRIAWGRLLRFAGALQSIPPRFVFVQARNSQYVGMMI